MPFRQKPPRLGNQFEADRARGRNARQLVWKPLYDRVVSH